MAAPLTIVKVLMEDKKPPTPRQRPIGTLGPIADLERHLPTEWWRDLFDSLYLKTDGDVVENHANTSNEIDTLLKATDLNPEDRILDLCCGQGRHALELTRRHFEHVTGIDRSRYLVRMARKRARKEKLSTTFREGDARHIRFPDNAFDCVIMMGNSFGYFDREEDDGKVLSEIRRVMRSGGVLALDLTDGEWVRKNYEPRSWEWIDQNHFVCRERSLSNDGERLISREVITHAERGVIADQFYAERLYSEEKIMQLLEQEGYLNIRHHGVMNTESSRGQDLGMMAMRLFLTAEAPRKMSSVKKKKTIVRVAVLLGDPRLPDIVKRGGQFNPEDYETINRLKEALGKLKDFDFSYLDNHKTFERDLAQLAPDLVLNLCDEGFNNDAFMELHVPALLEMLNLPYTGAAPLSLGLCFDKALVRAIADMLSVPVPLETPVKAGDRSATLPGVFPALLKPACGDSSIGITKDAVVHTTEELISYLETLQTILPDRMVLVQEFLSGAEYSVALIGNPPELEALPILEVDFSGLDKNLAPILGYESKWIPESPYWNQISYHETKLDHDQQRLLVEHSCLLFERLGCRDYARFDFRADSAGVIKLLEVNPNPGWCWDGKLNLMAEFAGRSYADLLFSILVAALERTRRPHPATLSAMEVRAAE